MPREVLGVGCGGEARLFDGSSESIQARKGFRTPKVSGNQRLAIAVVGSGNGVIR